MIKQLRLCLILILLTIIIVIPACSLEKEPVANLIQQEYVSTPTGHNFLFKKNKITPLNLSYDNYPIMLKGAIAIASNDWGTSMTSKGRITRDKDNNIHVVFTKSDGVWYTISKDNGIKWSTPIKILDDNGNWPSPVILADSNNNLHVFASKAVSDPYSSRHLYYIKKTSRGVWQTPVRITNEQSMSYTNYGPFASAVIDNNDNIYVTWERFESYDPAGQINPCIWDFDIFYRKYENGRWKGTMTLENDNNDSGLVTLDIDKNNNLHAVWNVADPDENCEKAHLKYSYNLNNPMKIKPEFKTTEPPTISSYDDIYIVSKANDAIYYIIKNDDWGSVKKIDQTTGISKHVSASADNSKLYVFWKEYIEWGESGIFAKVLSNDKWSQRMRISHPKANISATFPVPINHKDNGTELVWTQSNVIKPGEPLSWYIMYKKLNNYATYQEISDSSIEYLN